MRVGDCRAHHRAFRDPRDEVAQRVRGSELSQTHEVPSGVNQGEMWMASCPVAVHNASWLKLVERGRSGP